MRETTLRAVEVWVVAYVIYGCLLEFPRLDPLSQYSDNVAAKTERERLSGFDAAYILNELPRRWAVQTFDAGVYVVMSNLQRGRVDPASKK